MKKKEKTNSIIEICPVRNVIARFGNKWALLTLLIIGEHDVVRFNELNRLIPDVSSRVLSSTLRTLEADGLIDRKVYAVVPPKVEYRLTGIGKSLLLGSFRSGSLPVLPASGADLYQNAVSGGSGDRRYISRGDGDRRADARRNAGQ